MNATLAFAFWYKALFSSYWLEFEKNAITAITILMVMIVILVTYMIVIFQEQPTQER